MEKEGRYLGEMKVNVYERMKAEQQYHDAKTIKNIQYHRGSGARSAYALFSERIGDVRGLRVGDVGCGDGWYSIKLCHGGAEVLGMDISHELLKIAVAHVRARSLSNGVRFARMAAESLALHNEVFDLLIGSAILHHTHIELTLEGVSRVLKRGGRAIFIEPMNENVFLRLWRKLTPWRRSPTERALKKEDLAATKKVFNRVNFHYFYLTSIVSQGLLIISQNSDLLIWLNRLLEKVDRILLKAYPFLGRFCAVVVMELWKEDLEVEVK